MKKILFVFVLTAVLFAEWSIFGLDSLVATSPTMFPSMAIRDSVVYVGYSCDIGDNRATVKSLELDRISEYEGNPFFSAELSNWNHLMIDSTGRKLFIHTSSAGANMYVCEDSIWVGLRRGFPWRDIWYIDAAIDNIGDVYIVASFGLFSPDNLVVWKIKRDGTVVPLPTDCFSGMGGYHYTKIAVDSSSRVYIAYSLDSGDCNNKGVLKEYLSGLECWSDYSEERYFSDDPTGFIDVVLDENNTPYVSYKTYNNVWVKKAKRDVYEGAFVDTSEYWGNTSIDIDKNNCIYLAYVSSGETVNVIKMVRFIDELWSVEFQAEGNHADLKILDSVGYLACAGSFGLSVFYNEYYSESGIEINSTKLKSFSVYPNPFNSVIEIETPERVDVKIYDIRGRLVGTPTNSRWEPGSDLSSGVYFARIKTDSETISKKLMYVK